MKIFLGGTTDNDYHTFMVQKLKSEYSLDIDNVLPLQYIDKSSNDYWLYIITPKNKDMLSIANLVDHSNKNPKQLLFVFLIMDDYFRFDHNEWLSLCAISSILKEKGTESFNSINDAVKLLKIKYREELKCGEDELLKQQNVNLLS